jgi:hypothetical protein
MNQQPTTSQELSGQCQHGMHGNNRVERIPDATVPIGSDLDLRQVYCEYVTGIFRKLLHNDADKNCRISINIF